MKVLKHPVILILFFLALGILADYYVIPSFAIVFSVTIIAGVAFAISYLHSKK